MQDYKQTPNGDLDLTAGDLLVVESTRQHQRDLLLADKGHIRYKPQAGVGVVNFLLENEPTALMRTTRHEFTGDGMTVARVVCDKITNELDIDAEYEADNR